MRKIGICVVLLFCAGILLSLFVRNRSPAVGFTCSGYADAGQTAVFEFTNRTASEVYCSEVEFEVKTLEGWRAYSQDLTQRLDAPLPVVLSGYGSWTNSGRVPSTQEVWRAHVWCLPRPGELGRAMDRMLSRVGLNSGTTGFVLYAELPQR